MKTAWWWLTKGWRCYRCGWKGRTRIAWFDHGLTCREGQ